MLKFPILLWPVPEFGFVYLLKFRHGFLVSDINIVHMYTHVHIGSYKFCISIGVLISRIKDEVLHPDLIFEFSKIY